MSRYVIRNGSSRLELDTDALSDLFVRAGSGPLLNLANSAAREAAKHVRPSGRRFIGYKPPATFPLKSADIGRPPSPLASNLRVPVALVFNNSRFAVQQEIGSLSSDKPAERPLTSVLNTFGARRGVRALREKELNDAVKFGTRSRASRRKGAKK